MKKLLVLIIVLSMVMPSFASVRFDGTDDLILLSDNGILDSATSVSISFWANMGTLATSERFLHKWDAGTHRGILVSVENNDEILCAFANGNLDIFKTASTNLITGVWYHIVVVWNDNNSVWRIYVNGSSEGLATVANQNVSTIRVGDIPFEIGGKGTDGQFLEMTQSEVAIWKDVQLTQEEVTQLYKSQIKGMPLQIQPAGLVGYWPLDDVPDGTSGDSATFLDLSKNGNNATGDDGGNNTGLTARAEVILSYQPYVMYPLVVAAAPPAAPSADVPIILIID